MKPLYNFTTVSKRIMKSKNPAVIAIETATGNLLRLEGIEFKEISLSNFILTIVTTEENAKKINALFEGWVTISEYEQGLFFVDIRLSDTGHDNPPGAGGSGGPPPFFNFYFG